MTRGWLRLQIALLGCVLTLATAHAEHKPQKRAKKASASAYDLQAALKAKREGKSAADVASEEPAPIDAGLASELRTKIASCYQAETGNPLAEADRKLVDEYSESLVRELESGYSSTGCASNAPATEQCLSQLKLLSCAQLAEGIRNKRWDLHILPEERRMVTSYTEAIVKRKWQCAKERGVETDPIAQQVETDKLAIVVMMNITIGRCSLLPKGEAACKQLIASAPCVEIDERNKHNALLDICSLLVPCKTGPAVE
jgi:hypothetical protein